MEKDRHLHPHMELTQKIIGAAMLVHRALGPGLDGKIYENALCLELSVQKLEFTQQEHFPVYYRECLVGRLITDLIAQNQVIIETKAVSAINEFHVSQILSYLSITGLQVGLVFNFRTPSLTFKRVANIHFKRPQILPSVIRNPNIHQLPPRP